MSQDGKQLLTTAKALGKSRQDQMLDLKRDSQLDQYLQREGKELQLQVECP